VKPREEKIGAKWGREGRDLESQKFCDWYKSQSDCYGSCV